MAAVSVKRSIGKIKQNELGYCDTAPFNSPWDIPAYPGMIVINLF